MPPTSPAPSPGGSPPAATDGFRAVVRFDLDDEAPWRRWAALVAEGHATPFQTVAVTRPLLVRLCPALGTRPFLLEVFDAADVHVLSMALCLRAGAIRRIEFADFGLVDLAAPVFRADLDLTGGRAEALRRAVLAALPAHDALLLAKMPTTVAGRPNPLAAWPGTVAMNVVTMVFDPATRPVAELSAVKESGRKRRRLARDGGDIRRVDAPLRARALLDFAFDLRAEKARRDGRYESLDDPEVRDFYREMVATGLADGSVEVWEVTLGERILAMVLGLTRAGRFNGTLMATLEDEGLNVYSPGMIAVATVLEHHVGRGGGLFDLGPGEHPYKLRFGGVPSALLEYDRAASLRGLFSVADHRLRRHVRAHLRRHPALRARIYRLLGKG